MRLVSTFASAALATLLASHSADAGFQANFTGTGAGRSLSGQFAGQLKFTQISGSPVSWIAGSNGGSFISFCIQMNQFTTPNPNSFATANLEYAPVGNGSSPMLTKADDIRRLWAAVHGGLGTNNDKNAAFQATIWKILYGYNGYTNNSAVTALVNNYYAAATNINGAKANLVALTTINNQDQVVEVNSGWYVNNLGEVVAAPVPPALIMVLTGLVPFAAAYRRVRAAKSSVAG
jgi:hypothetical protein